MARLAELALDRSERAALVRGQLFVAEPERFEPHHALLARGQGSNVQQPLSVRQHFLLLECGANVGCLCPFFDQELEALWDQKLFYSDAVADFETLVRQKDLVLGYRLHGNLMALANRVPSIYFIYDSRTAEFCETFAIPSYDVYSDQELVLEEYWDQARFERFNRAYYMRYRDMRDFLVENAIPNKMRPARRFVKGR